ncbi:MAG: BrnT family toxin [Acidobacteriaceae bacterium]
MVMSYEWNDGNLSHIAKHGVSSREAEEVIENDPYDLDVQIVNGEVRTPHLGETNAGRILIVIATWIEEEQAIRVVTVFEPSKVMREKYVLWKGSNDGAAIEDTGISKPGRRSALVGGKSGHG